MKFLIVLTIASVCVLNSEAFFFGKHGKKGGESSSGASASGDSFGQSDTYGPPPVEQPPAPAPVQVQSQAQASSGGHGGFDISSLIAIPMQLKMKLLEAKKQKIEKIVGKFSSLTGSLTNSFSGLSGKFGGGHGHGGGASSSSSSGAAVAETYQQQPSPQHAYQQTPVVLHLYQIENSAQSHANSVASSYQAPAPQYGPPAAPVAQQQVSSVDTSYLPPHGNCQDQSHYH